MEGQRSVDGKKRAPHASYLSPHAFFGHQASGEEVWCKVQVAGCIVGISVAGFWFLVEEDEGCKVQVARWKKFVCNES